MLRTLKIARSLLVFVPILLVGARCVDHQTLYRDDRGNLHVVGEIYNDTDVQGVDIVVGGTLYDAAGNVLASDQALICPNELSPHTRSTFDVEFHNSSGVPMPARYDVRPISGKTLATSLPALKTTLSSVTARRSGGSVEVKVSIRATQGYEGFYYGCLAFYNAASDVVRQDTIIGFGDLPAGVPQSIDMIEPQIPTEARNVRLWIVGPGASVIQSDYMAFMTDSIPIQ